MFCPCFSCYCSSVVYFCLGPYRWICFSLYLKVSSTTFCRVGLVVINPLNLSYHEKFLFFLQWWQRIFLGINGLSWQLFSRALLDLKLLVVKSAVILMVPPLEGLGISYYFQYTSFVKKYFRVWGHSPVAEPLPSTHETKNSITSSATI